MKLFSIFCVFIASMSLMASSILPQEEGEVVCYARTYSDKHLKAHPEQTVEQMFLAMQKSKEFDSTNANFEVRFKKESPEVKAPYYIYQNILGCKTDENSGNITCGIDCDGGSFTLETSKKSFLSKLKKYPDSILLKNNGVILNGGCGDPRQSIHLNNTQEHSVFKLYKVRAEQCKYVQHFEEMEYY